MIEHQPNLQDPFKIYTAESVRAYIQRQIQELSESNRLVTSRAGRLFVRIRLTHEIAKSKLIESPIDFSIKLTEGFPITPPRVYMLTSLTNPTTSDARDYLQDILGQSWEYTMRLKQIEEAIPAFVDRVCMSKSKSLDMQKLGSFHLGESFCYAALREWKGIELFISFQEQEQRVLMNILTLSDSHLVVFRPELQPTMEQGKLRVPEQSQINIVRVVFYAQIQSVAQIRISRTDNSEIELTLKTQRYRKMVIEPFIVKIHYRLVRLREFLIKLMKAAPKFQSLEMNYETTRKDQFADIQQHVKNAENNLRKYFNKDNINVLNSTYQLAVECLSGMGNPAYLVYLNKITQLSLREDVKLVTSATDKS